MAVQPDFFLVRHLSTPPVIFKLIVDQKLDFYEHNARRHAAPTRLHKTKIMPLEDHAKEQVKMT